MASRSLKLVLALCSIAAVAACKKEQAGGAPGGGAPGGGMPPPEVGVFVLQPQSVALTTDLPGRTVPYRVADVRPQVSGVIQKRLFEEGGEVKAGQPLYQIDAAPFEAALSSARASQVRAEANAKSAQATVERFRGLVEVNAVSRQEYDNAVAAADSAKADVAAAKAAVDTARINVNYTKVTSPIAGRAGRSLVTEGALVTASQAQSLVVVQQLDPIYVDVVQPSVTLLNLRRQLAQGTLKRAGEDAAETHLVLEDGSRYGPTGKLQFSEVTVDSGTGSVTLRALFPNPGRVLLPGMFVHATVEEGSRENTLLVPQQAVTHSQKGEPVALVVGADNKVEQRTLKTDRAIGTDWLVSDGLKAGDRVIVQGLQSAKPGAPATPRELKREDLNSQAQASAPPPGGAAAGAAPAKGDDKPAQH